MYEKDEKLIPPGSYCYIILDIISKGANYPPVLKTLRCPYLSINKDHPEQENGYCAFLEQGDWDDGHGGLLWDGVKECGINEENFITGLHKREGCFGKEQEWLRYMLEQNLVKDELIDLVKRKAEEK